MKFTNAGRSVRMIPFGSLKVGDTFLRDGRIGIKVSRCGHEFPIDLTTGDEFHLIPSSREWIGHNPIMLSPDDKVARVDCELIFKIID